MNTPKAIFQMSIRYRPMPREKIAINKAAVFIPRLPQYRLIMESANRASAKSAIQITASPDWMDWPFWTDAANWSPPHKQHFKEFPNVHNAS